MPRTRPGRAQSCTRPHTLPLLIQASFIDEPRESVEEANELVKDLTETITQRFRDGRQRLEDHWEEGEEVSTEDLRITLQRYRSFFDRLLSLQ